MYDKDFGGGYDYGGPSGDYGGDYYGDPQDGQKGPGLPDFSGVKAPKMDMTKLKPLIFLGIILLIIGGGIFFFLSIQHNITFNIEEANGPEVYARIDIEKPDGTRVYRNSNIASDQVNLWNGEYDITVTKSGYDPFTRSIIVPDDTPDDLYGITLHRSLNATISVSTNQITSIYGTKSIPGEVTIQNNGTEAFQGELKIDSEEVEVTFPNGNKNNYSITLPGNSPTIITFDLAMKEAPNNTSPVSLDFIITGTIIKQKVDLTANPSPELELSESDLTNTKITAGAQIKEEIDVSNESSFEARDLKIEIVPDPNYEDRLSWFTFSPFVGEAYKTEISLLAKRRDAGDSKTLRLFVEPPISASIGDEFKGHFILDSNTLESPLSIPVHYVITKVLETNVTLSTGSTPVTVKTQSVDKKFTITNDGATNVENVVLKVENYSICDITWLRFLNDEDLDSQIEIGTLPKKGTTGNSRDINLRLVEGALSSGKVDCKLVWTYSDPINIGETLTEFVFYTINYEAPEED